MTVTAATDPERERLLYSLRSVLSQLARQKKERRARIRVKLPLEIMVVGRLFQAIDDHFSNATWVVDGEAGTHIVAEVDIPRGDDE